MSNQPNPSTIPARHAAMVRDLIKKPEFILGEMNLSKAALLHCAIGIVGEIGEIIECLGQEHENRENLLEEIGDFCFYYRDLRDWIAGNKPDEPIEVSAEFRMPNDGPSLVSVAMVACGELLDVVKKHVIYGQVMNFANLMKASEQITICVEMVMVSVRITEDEAMEANINKLSKRYPKGGYSDGDAAARADKACDFIVPNSDN